MTQQEMTLEEKWHYTNVAIRGLHQHGKRLGAGDA